MAVVKMLKIEKKKMFLNCKRLGKKEKKLERKLVAKRSKSQKDIVRRA